MSLAVPILPGEPILRNYLLDLDRRVALIEGPKQPQPAYPMASTLMNTTNAKTYVNCVVYATDLNVLAHSNGAHWYREDTGAMIV